MSTNPTIIDLKIAFLRTQINALSAPLRPSSDFTTAKANRVAEDGDDALRQKAIDEALYQLNAQLRRHNKLAYGPQATRHVAEQVDRLYWNAGERGVGSSGGGVQGEEWRERGVDLRDERIIAQIPDQWRSETKNADGAAKFAELQARLKEASERRRAAREKVEAYRKVKDLLEPFAEEGGVQENLVTKNGDVERELERMRMLMLRVERGVAGIERMEERVVDDSRQPEGMR